LPNGVAFLGDLFFFSRFQRSVIGAVPIAVVTGYLEIY